MKNRGSTPILTNLVGVHLRNIHTKFEANPYRGSREEVNNEILHSDMLVGWLVVFNVPSTARSFRDGTPIYCPLRRT